MDWGEIIYLKTTYSKEQTCDTFSLSSYINNNGDAQLQLVPVPTWKWDAPIDNCKSSWRQGPRFHQRTGPTRILHCIPHPEKKGG